MQSPDAGVSKAMVHNGIQTQLEVASIPAWANCLKTIRHAQWFHQGMLATGSTT